MKVLFVRPPRYMWPMNSESSSFWQPLGFASMAAVLRENDIDVEIIDCLPLKMGWKTLKRQVEQKRPDVLALGDEMASSIESLKLAAFSKQILPETKVVGGGFYFSYMDDSLDKGFDYLIRGEGEMTMLDLCREIQKKNPNLKKIDGLTYKQDGMVRKNQDRELIKDLDTLPFPAYDLLPMSEYGKDSTNHKDYSAIEHGRGCVNGCTFCSVWRIMSYKNQPCYRTKSAERSYEETEMLAKRFHRKTLNFVDGTYNASPKWTNDYNQLVIDNNLNIQQTNWMRTDLIIRDEKLGLMKKMVDAGLVQTVVGVERISEKDLLDINKRTTFENAKKAMRILKSHKKVYTIASFIYGTPDETKESLKSLNRIVHSDFADMIFLLPFTPYPGTEWWDKYKDQLEEKDYTKYNLHLPVMGSKYVSRQELNKWFKSVLLWYSLWPDQLFKRLVLEKDARKRRVQLSLCLKILKGSYVKAYNTLTFQNDTEHDLEYGTKPKWYDS